MNKIQKVLAIATIVSAVGISYAMYNLKGIPDAFDWDMEEDDE